MAGQDLHVVGVDGGEERAVLLPAIETEHAQRSPLADGKAGHGLGSTEMNGSPGRLTSARWPVVDHDVERLGAWRLLVRNAGRHHVWLGEQRSIDELVGGS